MFVFGHGEWLAAPRVDGHDVAVPVRPERVVGDAMAVRRPGRLGADRALDPPRLALHHVDHPERSVDRVHRNDRGWRASEHQAAAVGRYADLVVVGSALVRVVHEAGSADAPEAARRFVATLRRGLDGA